MSDIEEPRDTDSDPTPADPPAGATADAIDDAMKPSAASGLTKKKRPVAGLLWGILFGLGLAITAVNFKLIVLEVVPVVVVVVIGIVLGVIWSTFGPAKTPKGVG